MLCFSPLTFLYRNVSSSCRSSVRMLLDEVNMTDRKTVSRVLVSGAGLCFSRIKWPPLWFMYLVNRLIAVTISCVTSQKHQSTSDDKCVCACLCSLLLSFLPSSKRHGESATERGKTPINQRPTAIIIRWNGFISSRPFHFCFRLPALTLSITFSPTPLFASFWKMIRPSEVAVWYILLFSSLARVLWLHWLFLGVRNDLDSSFWIETKGRRTSSNREDICIAVSRLLSSFALLETKRR